MAKIHKLHLGGNGDFKKFKFISFKTIFSSYYLIVLPIQMFSYRMPTYEEKIAGTDISLCVFEVLKLEYYIDFNIYLHDEKGSFQQLIVIKLNC